MARPPLRFHPDQLRQIIELIRALDLEFLCDNHAFLSGVIDGIWNITQRIYGARRYALWLAEAGVRRRPSNMTLQKAVDRARDHVKSAAGGMVDSIGLRSASRKFAETGTLVGAARAVYDEEVLRGMRRPRVEMEWMEIRIRAEVAERALEHEAARNRHLQAAMVDLERSFGEAQAVAMSRASFSLTNEISSRLEQIFEMATRLEGVANALAGTERFLRLQNDAVRQQTQHEAEQLRQRIHVLEAEIGQLRTQIDAYRCVSGCDISAQGLAKPPQ